MNQVDAKPKWASSQTLEQQVQLVNKARSLFSSNHRRTFGQIENEAKFKSVMDKIAEMDFETKAIVSDSKLIEELEAIVLIGRPVYTVENDAIDLDQRPTSHWGPYSEEWKRLLSPHLDKIASNIQRVGRIEIFNPDYSRDHRERFMGTCSLVAPNIVLTNRHVAETFAYANGTFQPGVRARVDFVEEQHRDPDNEFIVTRVIEMGTTYDYALLEIEGDSSLPDPLQIKSRSSFPFLEGNPYVYIVGYPAFDSRNPSNLQMQIFDSVFDVKRLSPGELKRIVKDPPYVGRPQRDLTLEFDYTSLGGNSGSPVFDLDTGLILGLHYAGKYETANYGVPVWEIQQRILSASRERRYSVSISNMYLPSIDTEQSRNISEFIEDIKNIARSRGLVIRGLDVTKDLQYPDENCMLGANRNGLHTPVLEGPVHIPPAPPPLPPVNVPTGINIGRATISPTGNPIGLNINVRF